LAITASKRVRLADVASKAGVSRGAVAHVLHGTGAGSIRVGEDTALRIRRAAEQLHYRPNAAAQQLRNQQSRLIGVLIDAYAPQPRLYGLARIEHALRQRGYRVLVGYGHDDPAAFRAHRDDFVSRGIDGLICLSHDYTNPAIAEEVVALVDACDVPVVMLDEPRFPAKQASIIRIQREAAIREAAARLLAHHPQPAMLMLDPASSSVTQREAGFRAALREADVDHPEHRLLRFSREALDGEDGGFEAFVSERILEAGYDLVFAHNDLIATRLLRLCAQRGVRVPDDLAVVGYGNGSFAPYTLPSLSTFDAHEDRLATLAVAAAIDRIEQREPAEGEREDALTPRLIERESTRRARSHELPETSPSRTSFERSR